MLEKVMASLAVHTAPKNVSRLLSAILTLVILFAYCTALQAGDDQQGVPRGGCPDLIQLIRDLAPEVVNISIERHLLQSDVQGSQKGFSGANISREGSRDSERMQSDSQGSGFIFDPAGIIVTNAHVVEGAGKILVTFSTGKVVPAKVLAVHPKVDLALISVPPPFPLKNSKIGDSSRVQVGEWVLAVGNPFGLGRTVTVGIVSGMGRFIGLGPDDDFIQTDASINPGNSGGPLFNMAGEVIGVNTAIISAGKGIGFSIPSNHIEELTKIPRNGEPPLRGWLGIFVEDVTDDHARSMGLSHPIGTIVDEVLSSTPADSAGLRRGDVILDADGKQIANGRHLSRIVSAAKPGELLRMTILREKQTRSLDVVIGKSPE